jgi:uncharacterized YkwD family protein
MKNKIIALTLSAILALSSTTAFAAEGTNVVSKYSNDNNLNYYISEIVNGNIKVKSVKVNGQTVDLNSVDWNVLLNTAETEQVITEVEKPVVNKTEIQKPAETKKADVKQQTQPTAVRPAEQQSSPAKEEAVVSPNTAQVSANLSFEQKVVQLVNVERQKSGLQPLTLDSEISNVARTKSKDMADNNYFAHQSPTYGSAGDMLTKFGIRWSAWGENIASGQRTPESVVTAWMNSEGHRANIMSPNFSRIGVGYVANSGGTPYWTQVFAD